jgi:hypothetical protein
VTDVTEVIAIAAVRTLHADPAAEFVVKPPAYAADFVVKAVAVADFVVKAAPAYAADFVVADETQQKADADADVDADEDC